MSDLWASDMEGILPFHSCGVASEKTTPAVAGGKGHNLIRMKEDGLPVPSGFVIPTTYCNQYRKELDKAAYMDSIMDEVMDHYDILCSESNHGLVSVRSGAPVSMPGMMDTVLNVGVGYREFKATKKFKTKCRDKFTEMFVDVVIGEKELYPERKPDEWMEVIQSALPTMRDLLRESIEAVFKSWDNERARTYRKLHGISEDMGTAVVVQLMVFGNWNTKSCSGVLFTRNPNTGEKVVMGEFLPDAQGEDVVAGTVTPKPLEDMKAFSPKVYKQLMEIASGLEDKARDMQDIEFTVENGDLYILQTRNGKRAPLAEVMIAIDLLAEGKIEEYSERLSEGVFHRLMQPSLPKGIEDSLKATGLPSGGYIATGKAVANEDEAKSVKGPTILVAGETTPDDLPAMLAVDGIVTTKGGATSHAAVVARGMGKPCVVGAEELDLQSTLGSYVLLDGQTGKVYVADEPFPEPDAPKFPVEVVGRVLGGSLVDGWVTVSGYEEALDLEDYLLNIAVPMSGVESADQIVDLSNRFDRVAIQIDPAYKDLTVALLGGADSDALSESIVMIEEAIAQGAEVYTDGIEVEGALAIEKFRNVRDLLDSSFVGVVSLEFIESILGGQDVYDRLADQVGLASRDYRPLIIPDVLERIVKLG